MWTRARSEAGAKDSPPLPRSCRMSQDNPRATPPAHKTPQWPARRRKAGREGARQGSRVGGGPQHWVEASLYTSPPFWRPFALRSTYGKVRACREMLSARVPPRRAAEVSDGAVLDVRGSWFGLCSAGFGGAVYAARSGAFTASFSLFGASCADSVACGARRKGRAGGGGARQSEACALGVASFKRPPHAAGSDWDVTPGALATALNKRRPAPPPLPRPRCLAQSTTTRWRRAARWPSSPTPRSSARAASCAATPPVAPVRPWWPGRRA